MPGFEGLLSGRTLVGRYRIDEVVGRGGFAAVYRGFDERLRRRVAVKVITLSASNPEAREGIQKRFHREARAIARMDHPNVITIYDFGLDETLGLDFLVMELLEGEDLSGRLASPEPLPMDVAVQILHGAALGVAEGHRAGLIHRDVKPSNIVLSTGRPPDRIRPVVLDFGIARFVLADEVTQLTRSGGLVLSPAYAAPEQLRGERDVTPAADVFSLGVIGYEMLTRERAFPGNRLQTPADEPEPVPLRVHNPAVPPGLAEVIHRAMAHDPVQRYPDAGAFAEDLSEARAALQAETRSVPLAPAVAPASASGATEEDARTPDPVGLPFRDAPLAVHPTPPPPVRGPKRRARRIALLAAAGAVVGLGVWGIGREWGSPDPVSRTDTVAAAAASDPPDEPVTAESAAEAPAPVAPGAPPTVRETPRAAAAIPAVRSDGARQSRPAADPTDAPRRASPAASAPPRTASPTDASRSRAAAPPAEQGIASAPAARLNREGELYFERGDLTAAAERFRRAVRGDPTNAAYRNNLAWALFQLSDVDGAARELEEVLRLAPERAIAHANLGEVRRARGDREGAIAAYQRFLELNQDPRRERIAREKLRSLREQ